MKYFQNKDWQYHVKSAIATFFAVFIPLFFLQISAYNVDTLTVADITSDSMIAGIVALLRVVLVTTIQTVMVLYKKSQL